MANNHIGITQSAVRAGDLRAVLGNGINFRSAVAQLARSLPQYGADSAGYAAIEADFGLAPGSGQAVADLIPACLSELTGGIGAATFVAQLLDRLG